MPVAMEYAAVGVGVTSLSAVAPGVASLIEYDVAISEAKRELSAEAVCQQARVTMSRYTKAIFEGLKRSALKRMRFMFFKLVVKSR